MARVDPNLKVKTLAAQVADVLDAMIPALNPLAPHTADSREAAHAAIERVKVGIVNLRMIAEGSETPLPPV